VLKDITKVISEMKNHIDSDKYDELSKVKNIKELYELEKSDAKITSVSYLFYTYLSKVKKRRIKGYEKYILKDNFWARHYACEMIKGKRWKALENKIIKEKDYYNASHYAKYNIGGRWPKGEEIIMRCNEGKYYNDFNWGYIKKFVHKRSKNIEKVLFDINFKDKWTTNKYIQKFIKSNTRWPEAEPFMTIDWTIYEYVRKVIKGRWFEKEDLITSPEYIYKYSVNYVKHKGNFDMDKELLLITNPIYASLWAKSNKRDRRWDLLENIIFNKSFSYSLNLYINESEYAYHYVKNTLNITPELEKIINKDPFYASYYRKWKETEVYKGYFKIVGNRFYYKKFKEPKMELFKDNNILLDFLKKFNINENIINPFLNNDFEVELFPKNSDKRNIKKILGYGCVDWKPIYNNIDNNDIVYLETDYNYNYFYLNGKELYITC
jgi:hypothetical protein